MGRYALSNKAPNGVERVLPLALAPTEAVTIDLESSTYKGKYTNKITVGGTHKATILLPKVADNKGCTINVSQISGTAYAEVKYQTGEQSGASILQLSAAKLNAVFFSDGSTWTAIESSAANVNS